MTFHPSVNRGQEAQDELMLLKLSECDSNISISDPGGNDANTPRLFCAAIDWHVQRTKHSIADIVLKVGKMPTVNMLGYREVSSSGAH